MTQTQAILTILTCGIATILIRALPFLAFRKDTPKYIVYLGNALPPAIFAMLVVYCLKDVSLVSGSHGIPEAAGMTVTILLHLWKKQTLLSIAGGTICCMLLMQFIF
ncbi:MAG: branched-chain amino acid transporter permease [Erysipelotrichaceae bacterium]|nr:branched-chain amino acid transporter permease [Solobacterium sp.]MDO5121558.1 branched-chain amino acid transporter permease [Erysipelotrichaceae bacterium]